MAEETPTATPSSINFMNGKTPPARANISPYTHRPLGRASTFADVPSSLTRRRGSTLSDTLDETRQSIRSSTDDLLLPKPLSPHSVSSGEHSYWHSSPLALALLPALGGLFFKNGSALVTDLTLLVLAAVFLNWSVRLPWDWYHSARSIQLSSHPHVENSVSDDTIIEEETENEDEKMKNSNGWEKISASVSSKSKSDKSTSQSSAESELRLHELVALFTCFISPMIGAWLLHTIRYQLSRPSEGLVSNYNLTIFLLAAEIRPLAHLTKLVQARTLYLQRSINPSAIPGSISPDVQRLQDLSFRLDDLEAHVAMSVTTSAKSSLAAAPTAQITTEVRKSMQPDLDALNRAVRRYEKRATLLTMQTESRLQDLESRMADAITLAAAAERSIAQKPRYSSALTLLDWLCAIIVLPVQTINMCINLSVQVVRTTVTAIGFRSQTQNQNRNRNPKVNGTRGSGGENGYLSASASPNGTANANANAHYEKRSPGKVRSMKRA